MSEKDYENELAEEKTEEFQEKNDERTDMNNLDEDKKCQCKNEASKKNEGNKEEVETPEMRMKKLELELQEWKNSYTRKLAEFQNFTKRKEAEVSEMKKYASEDIIIKLLDNIDNLERAVDASKESQNFDSLIEGVNMILNNLKHLLAEEGVEEIEAAGKEYDPYEHKAMITENKEELDDNVVVQVFQKGYKMKGKVVRPAMVTVNKKQ